MDSKKYLSNWFDEIGFLEQREDGSHILGGVPIPMLERDIIEEVKHPGESGRLNVEHIFTAMCVVIGLDERFPYREDYLKFLKEHPEDTVLAIEERMAEAIDEENTEKLYLLAAAKEAVRGTIDDQLETTYAMEGIYNLHWREDGGATSEDLLQEISDRYEKMLEKDPEHPKANMALGRIYEARAMYIKAKFYYERALTYAKDGELRETLRGLIEEVEEPAAIDGARTYLHYGKYEEALDRIQEVDSQYADPGACNHIIGMAHYGMGDYDVAVDYLKEAARHKKTSEVYNDYAIALAATGKERNAIKVLSDAIEEDDKDRTAHMNRGILYYREENFEKALTDFEHAYRLLADEDLWALIEQTKALADASK